MDDYECDFGEICVGDPGEKICISEKSRIWDRPGALTLGRCSSSLDYATDRDCLGFENDQYVRCPTGFTCRCSPFEFDKCAEIVSSVACITGGETCCNAGNQNVCMDPNADLSSRMEPINSGTSKPTSTAGSSGPGIEEPNPPSDPLTGTGSEGTAEEPSTSDPTGKDDDTDEKSSRRCIAATEIAHLPSHKLLYPDHIHASVLCDKYGSCATPGNIVHYNGSPMMMKTYCEL